MIGKVTIDRIVERSTDAAASLCPSPISSEKFRTIDAVGHAVITKKVAFTSVGKGRKYTIRNPKRGIINPFARTAR